MLPGSSKKLGYGLRKSQKVEPCIFWTLENCRKVGKVGKLRFRIPNPRKYTKGYNRLETKLSGIPDNSRTFKKFDKLKL
eukprot:9502452-Pyramimonas_sp.AAC.1